MAPPSGSKRSRRAIASDISDISDEEDESSPVHRSTNSARQRAQKDVNSDERGEDGFQPGAIVRVKLINFVTYEDAVFYPGPNLNMVIGPNGTGKSSLVCAICIGLGYGAQHLGRAAKFGEFVKHGKDDAYIEIELYKRPSDEENMVVKVRVTRDGDKRKWWINGSEVSLRNVQRLVESLGIQVDNLCQFLPQDRVSEFAGLSPIQLLHETQRAAAPPEMIEWHDRLKDDRKEQKALHLSLEKDREDLERKLERQEAQRGDVERLRERLEIQEHITFLEKSVPFVEYRVARSDWADAKVRHKENINQLKALEEEVAPTLQAVNAKQEYHDQIEAVVTERVKELRETERAADGFHARIEKVDDDIKKVEQEKTADADGEKSRVQQLAAIKRKIRDYEAALQNAPPEFDAVEWQGKIRAQEHRIREIEAESRALDDEREDLMRQGNEVRNLIGPAQKELSAMDSLDGKNVNKLRALGPETAQAWEWITNNRGKFEQEVFGPPLISCKLKDQRYADQIESYLQTSNFLTITTQTREDFNTLSNALSSLRLADVQFQTSRYGPPPDRLVPTEQLRQLGLDGWAIDCIEGPEQVLGMLCNTARLDKTAVGLNDITEDQYNAIMQTPLEKVAAGGTQYSVFRRREYGAGATSTSTKTFPPARILTDAPVDTSFRNNIEEKIKQLEERFDLLKSRIIPVKAKLAELATDKTAAIHELDSLKAAKNNAQIAYGHFKSIPQKLEAQRDQERTKKQAGAEFRSRLQQYRVRVDDFAIKKSELVLEYKERIEAIREAHNALLEARLRLVEASSDVLALAEKNAGIARQVTDLRQTVDRAHRNMLELKQKAQTLLTKCQDLSAQADDETSERFTNIDKDLTLEDLHNQIDIGRTKLEYLAPGDPRALDDFNNRKSDIAHIERRMGNNQAKLDEIDTRIDELRGQWEPELDKLIAEISAAFAHNFERIGCAGEVGVHKDEDFELWSIEIKVKFRENESLQILDQHRQSGGERSVSTIFYLMALQSLARSPFRVVDEINQGMDPRNERMVHERMVEIACREHTSQYFLITPKLLTNLRYDRRMRVLCIASGEHMPKDHTGLDFKKVIAARRSLAMGLAR